MRFHSIIKSTKNSIVNSWANKDIPLSEIVSYPSLDTHYTVVFKNQQKQEFVHLNMDSILQNIDCLDMTIGEFADFICKDEYIKIYKCNDSLHPNLHKCLYGFSLGDVIDQTDVKFYDPNNAQYTKNFAIESATDLAISIRNKQNNKLVPIFDENIMFNDGNVTNVIIKDMRDIIINKYNQMLPIDKFYFLDLQPFGDSTKLTKLTNMEYSIENNTLVISNLREHMSNAKSCIMVLDKKFIPWKLVKFNKDSIRVNLNHLLTLNAFEKYTAEELINSYHSFVILFKNKLFTQVLNGINDIGCNSGDLYSTSDIPLNSIHLLNTENYGFSSLISLKVMLEDVNMQISFDSVYEDPFEPAESFRDHYNDRLLRTHIVTNRTFYQKEPLVPLYEDPELYKTFSGKLSSVNSTNGRFIPLRFIFSN